MRLTKAQKSAIRRSVAEHLADYVTEGWGEPLKDVDQSDRWPTLRGDVTDEEIDTLGDACMDYLDTAAKQVASQLRKMR